MSPPALGPQSPVPSPGVGHRYQFTEDLPAKVFVPPGVALLVGPFHQPE